jgi:hypothetical protein
VRRRIGFAGVAVAAVSLIVGVGMALAATPSHQKHAKGRPVLLHCTSSPTTVAPQGQPAVDQPNSGGVGYGAVTCPAEGFGSGVTWDRYTIPDSGNMVGTYKQYFTDGEVTGTFDLQPLESPPLTADSFYSESFAGTVLVTGGTGVYKGVVSKNHKGTMTCDSPDSVHMTCTQNVKILIPAPATSGTTGPSGPQG